MPLFEKNFNDPINGSICKGSTPLEAAIESYIGKKHALKKYNQFAQNVTPVVELHEIFVTKIMNSKLIYQYIVEAKISWNCTTLK